MIRSAYSTYIGSRALNFDTAKTPRISALITVALERSPARIHSSIMKKIHPRSHLKPYSEKDR